VDSPPALQPPALTAGHPKLSYPLFFSFLYMTPQVDIRQAILSHVLNQMLILQKSLKSKEDLSNPVRIDTTG